MSAICSICGSDMTVQDGEGTAFCLSCENAGLRARIAELEAALEHGCCIDRLYTMLRQRGYVFNTPLDASVTDTNRWEKLAFRLWTELTEIDQVSRAALKGGADDEG